MKQFFMTMIFVVCMDLICSSSAFAEVDWATQQILNFETKPVDIIMSARGSYMFVLTEDGIVHVFDPAGNLKGQVDTGKNVDSIACGPDERLLILKSKRDKEVRTIILEFIQEIDVEGSPFKGNADAPIVIVNFTDYQWSYCARLSPIINQVIEKNRDKVKLVSKNMPLSMHKYARSAAAAALAADSMGKFWEFHEALYKNMTKLSDKKVSEIAMSLQLDPDEILKAMKSKEIQDKINKDIRDAEEAGVSGTPTVFINGKRLRDRSIEGFQDMIDAQLKKLK